MDGKFVLVSEYMFGFDTTSVAGWTRTMVILLHAGSSSKVPDIDWELKVRMIEYALLHIHKPRNIWDIDSRLELLSLLHIYKSSSDSDIELDIEFNAISDIENSKNVTLYSRILQITDEFTTAKSIW